MTKAPLGASHRASGAALGASPSASSSAPSGIIGAFAVNRPLLANTVISIGLVTLCSVGLRLGDAVDVASIDTTAIYAIIVLALPLVAAAFWPKTTAMRVLLLLVASAIGGVFIAIDRGLIEQIALPTPVPQEIVFAAAGVGLFLAFTASMTNGVLRYSAPAIFTSLLAVFALMGYLLIEGYFRSSQTGIFTALTFVAGMNVGISVSADFLRSFSMGARWKNAAASGGHGGVAAAAYCILVVASLGVVETLQSNFGAPNWRLIWAGITGVAVASAASLFAVAGGLSLSVPNEAAAATENRRSQAFRQSWRPIRLALPLSTAFATIAITGIFMVISMFNAGVPMARSQAMFFVLVWCSAAIVFVSVRTATLIVVLLIVGAFLTDYLFSILNIVRPDLLNRLSAYAFVALALGLMTISWRDMREYWRNAREVAENALNDGARKFVLAIGFSVASIYTVSRAVSWPDAPALIVYLLSVAVFSIALSPAFMIAMSARITGR